jgi:membrane-associated phospholipid phosphatase
MRRLRFTSMSHSELMSYLLNMRLGPALPRALIAEKLGLLVALGVLLTVPYFLIQHHQIFPAKVIPLTPIDSLVPFFQPAVYVYVSFHVMLILPLLLARDARNLSQMALGFAWIVCVSLLLFLIWPTTIPPLVSRSQVTDPLMRLVLSLDTDLNACPSLHASLAIYCGLCSVQLLKLKRQRAAVLLWVFLILAATLLTKRHIVIDLLAGAALGLATYAGLFMRQPRGGVD